MSMTVVTLTKVPLSLRGDLTKWMQEIATGVYVGNLNSKVRGKLWERITQNVKKGQATISYHTNNELGYSCETYHTFRKIVDCEGIPLVQIPKSDNHNIELQKNFSKAAKFHKVKGINKSRYQKIGESIIENETQGYVVFDIETSGLDATSDKIIEIGAVKYSSGKIIKFNYLIKIDSIVPQKIVDLTGIDNKLLTEKGHDLSEVINKFIDFISNHVLVGYNINFDLNFINKTLDRLGLDSIDNKYIDLLPLVKREKMFIDSYKLSDVLLSYDIDGKVQHRALSDSEAALKLSDKVNGFAEKLKLKR
ncbi:type I-E CRISPR-associated endoribonuclease Cas2e [Apilactobacillus kunkeei]|uniref:type I-E CRISPR-associated endoribonuclease Cas2e n=1 Tax=Apilactobacillus kunkeei TaxID=148814 RepID=UPI0006B25110|nr:type I-E CRISPR-associated endoribonuclease Cas2e [Apilactobacillus kunkeei]KOY70467.1 DNA polymerase III subunit alpha [Apilactobacillus kunkeei]CAI2621237.1 3'-5' exonuclease DinG [Apilactobacillus kunkeei]